MWVLHHLLRKHRPLWARRVAGTRLCRQLLLRVSEGRAVLALWRGLAILRGILWCGDERL